ncbi:MAG: YbaN family protein [Cellvibrionaceae bacterium]
MTLHYKILGFFAIGLAIIGLFLPLMPTTCFVLLAAWSFAKSSPKYYQRLLQHRLFGQMIQQWEDKRCISTKVRMIAIGSMLLSGGISLLLIDHYALSIILALLIAAGVYSIQSIKHCTL